LLGLFEPGDGSDIFLRKDDDFNRLQSVISQKIVLEIHVYMYANDSETAHN
jgi:hypothetical protein